MAGSKHHWTLPLPRAHEDNAYELVPADPNHAPVLFPTVNGNTLKEEVVPTSRTAIAGNSDQAKVSKHDIFKVSTSRTTLLDHFHTTMKLVHFLVKLNNETVTMDMYLETSVGPGRGCAPELLFDTPGRAGATGRALDEPALIRTSRSVLRSVYHLFFFQNLLSLYSDANLVAPTHLRTLCHFRRHPLPLCFGAFPTPKPGPALPLAFSLARPGRHILATGAGKFLAQTPSFAHCCAGS
ncbi:hypothetical protein B0H16DRAFT_1750080 [Mycena metata]|uniref:Uncharacterized protein n=1 Tax=Mycena metata TaxID=1033252 RepID=A0AAD7DSV5_9AGAR|nr:hypothetical protein B0H16DRAFT_1750080 [Mycena metata]